MESIVIPQDTHKFYGLAEIVYRYDKSKRHLKVIVNDRVMSEYRESWAEYIWHKMIFDNEPVKTYIKAKDLIIAASIVCDTNEVEIKSKTRKENVVFARQLVSWALREKLKYTLEAAGKIVNRDHSTIIWSVSIIEKPDKYIKPMHQHWRREFIKQTFGE